MLCCFLFIVFGECLYNFRTSFCGKKNIPVRPVLSMPGSAYHEVALYVVECLSVVPQCKINASTKLISDRLKEGILEENEEVISFDDYFISESRRTIFCHVYTNEVFKTGVYLSIGSDHLPVLYGHFLQYFAVLDVSHSVIFKCID